MVYGVTFGTSYVFDKVMHVVKIQRRKTRFLVFVIPLMLPDFNVLRMTIENYRMQ